MRFLFLRYWVTTDEPEIDAAFVVQAHARYDRLKLVLQPVNATVNELQHDWQPHKQSYWQNALAQFIPLRQALEECLSLFAEEQSSQTCPIPITVAATAFGYQHDLRQLEERIDEAGILLTSHSAALPSLDEAYLRQRQRVLKALRALAEEGRNVISKSRAELNKVRAESRRQSGRITQATRPALHVVGDGTPDQEEQA